jgi:small subunit ribosomal protein S19
MARSVKKGPYVQASLQRKIDRLAQSGGRQIIRTWSRRSMITPEMIGSTLHVHNGKLFMPVFVTENMVGHRLGEFAPTRKPVVHSGDRKVKAAPSGGPPSGPPGGGGAPAPKAGG